MNEPGTPHRDKGSRTEATSPSFSDAKVRHRRLPHWESGEAVYFVTFRLADSLPQSLLRSLAAQRADILATAKAAGRELSPGERRLLARLFSRRVERYLDAGSGACYLGKPGIAELIARALLHFDGSRYTLFAWCVMPNHVHVVFRPDGGETLADIVHSWKSFTSNAANHRLGRSGRFWQREYYDHQVRSGEEFSRIVRYVAENPLRAGLQNWRWAAVHI